MMIQPNSNISLLLIEDDDGFAYLIKELLAEIRSEYNVDFEFRIGRVKRFAEGIEELGLNHYDVILLDLNLPDSMGVDFFSKLGRCKISQPVIVLTSMGDEKFALDMIRNGAQDYLLKGEITGDRMIRSICYAIERQKLNQELNDARNRVEELQKILPICCICKKIRSDDGYWQEVETFMSNNSDIKISDELCPNCAEKE